MIPFTRRLTKALGNYLMFLLPVAFVTSCCVMLFVSMMASSMGLSLTYDNLGSTARLTCLNVFLISLLFMAFDKIRRTFTVDRPIKDIVEASDKIVQGDFSVRVPEQNGLFVDDNFNKVIDCFNRMASELSSVETLRTDFISDISHEMKTPLAVVQNYATLLQTPDLSEERRVEYAKGVVNGTRRISDMMTNILRLNRLENQRIFTNRKEFDLVENIRGHLLQFENIWEMKGIDVEMNVEGPIIVKADDEMLGIVWNNLFSNAFKFTDEGGKVTLDISSDEAYVHVTVKDTGCGMTNEIGAHIFDKFYQGDPSRSTQGNGLGLALVRRVMDIVGGEIEVESSPGAGAAFTIRIKKV